MARAARLLPRPACGSAARAGQFPAGHRQPGGRGYAGHGGQRAATAEDAGLPPSARPGQGRDGAGLGRRGDGARPGRRGDGARLRWRPAAEPGTQRPVHAAGRLAVRLERGGLAVQAGLVPGDQRGHRTRPERRRRGAAAWRPGRRAGPQELRQRQPFRRVLGQAGRDQAAQARGHGAELGRCVDHPVQHGGRVAVAERHAAGGGEAQHAAEREDVAGRADRLAPGLLGRHVGRGAEGGAGGRQRRAVQRAGDTEVDDPGPVGGQQHVGRLQVPVHQGAGVHGLQRLGQAGRQPPDREPGQRPVRADRVVQRGARHVAGRQPRRDVVRPGVDHLGRVQAVDRAGRVDLEREPPDERRVRGELGVADLDRHRPAARGVAEEDLAHPARTEPRPQPELPGAARVAGLERLDHRWTLVTGRLPRRPGSRRRSTRSRRPAGPPSRSRRPR